MPTSLKDLDDLLKSSCPADRAEAEARLQRMFDEDLAHNPPVGPPVTFPRGVLMFDSARHDEAYIAKLPLDKQAMIRRLLREANGLRVTVEDISQPTKQ